MRRRFLVLLLVPLAACGSSSQPAVTPGSPDAAPGEPVELVAVLDGDSFITRRTDGTEVEVRLLGINAPERNECLGDRARRALQELLDAGSIRLTAGSETTDQFGRLLRYVTAAGVAVNLSQLGEGLAIAIQTGHESEATFLETSDAAAAAGRGMWASDACGPPPPPVAIVDYVYDPPGRDEENANEEWVAFANESTDPIDVSGWTVRDESTQNRFRFPAGVVLGPGEEVRVRSGCGDSSGGRVFSWCAPNPVWSNGGDTILLLDNNGTVVAWERYSGDF